MWKGLSAKNGEAFDGKRFIAGFLKYSVYLRYREMEENHTIKTPQPYSPDQREL